MASVEPTDVASSGPSVQQSMVPTNEISSGPTERLSLGPSISIVESVSPSETELSMAPTERQSLGPSISFIESVSPSDTEPSMPSMTPSSDAVGSSQLRTRPPFSNQILADPNNPSSVPSDQPSMAPFVVFLFNQNPPPPTPLVEETFAPSVTPRTCKDVVIDFETAGDGTSLVAGDYITTPWFDEYGMTVTAEATTGGYTPDNRPRLFDTSNPGTDNKHGDPDLGSPNEACNPAGPGRGAGGAPGSGTENCVPQGLVLVIQEADTIYWDDNGRGGDITFDFATPMKEVLSVGLMDIDSGGNPTTVSVTTSDGRTSMFEAMNYPDNSVQTITFDAVDVVQVKINFPSTGAVTSIAFCDEPDPTPSPSVVLTSSPSEGPTLLSSSSPTLMIPSDDPSIYPSMIPSANPSDMPSRDPSSSHPPSLVPTVTPVPSETPSADPVGTVFLFGYELLPTAAPTEETVSPTAAPTTTPTAAPTSSPTLTPTAAPTYEPSAHPSAHPSSTPSDM